MKRAPFDNLRTFSSFDKLRAFSSIEAGDGETLGE